MAFTEVDGTGEWREGRKKRRIQRLSLIHDDEILSVNQFSHLLNPNLLFLKLNFSLDEEFETNKQKFLNFTYKILWAKNN